MTFKFNRVLEVVEIHFFYICMQDFIMLSAAVQFCPGISAKWGGGFSKNVAFLDQRFSIFRQEDNIWAIVPC